PRMVQSERRKFKISCFCAGVSLLNAPIELLASDPALECAAIACTRSLILPSCRKKIRWPKPHKGAVRNSSGPALPWTMSSARPVPMWCTSRSENRLAVLLLNAAEDDLPVCIDGVWHRAQPIALDINKARPLLTEEVQSCRGTPGPQKGVG